MEEDIKILKRIWRNLPFEDIEGRTAIQNFLIRYKQPEEKYEKQKELTKLAQTITDESIKEALEEFEKDYIPKSKIQEKIEEIKMTSSQINGDYFMNNYKIDVLQELLEEEGRC